jgi:hypothetical protein
MTLIYCTRASHALFSRLEYRRVQLAKRWLHNTKDDSGDLDHRMPSRTSELPSQYCPIGVMSGYTVQIKFSISIARYTKQRRLCFVDVLVMQLVGTQKSSVIISIYARAGRVWIIE